MGIKVERAIKAANTHRNAAMTIVRAIPEEVIDSPSSARLATLIDAMQARYVAGSIHADDEACRENWIFDRARQVGREISAV